MVIRCGIYHNNPRYPPICIRYIEHIRPTVAAAVPFFSQFCKQGHDKSLSLQQQDDFPVIGNKIEGWLLSLTLKISPFQCWSFFVLFLFCLWIAVRTSNSTKRWNKSVIKALLARAKTPYLTFISIRNNLNKYFIFSPRTLQHNSEQN